MRTHSVDYDDATTVFSSLLSRRDTAGEVLSDRSLLSDPSTRSATLNLRDGKIEIAYRPEEPAWLWSTLGALKSISALPENWDTYGSARVSDRTAYEALALLTRILPHEGPPPALVPMSSGGLQLEWHHNGLDVELSVSPSGGASGFFIDRNSGENLDLTAITPASFPAIQGFTRRLQLPYRALVTVHAPDGVGLDPGVELWRRIPPVWWVLDRNVGRHRLSSAAFDDSRDGSPLSVNIAAETPSKEQFLEGLTGYGIASLTVAVARSCKQDVVRAPTPTNPAHAHVVGPKTGANKECLRLGATPILEPTK